MKTICVIENFYSSKYKLRKCCELVLNLKKKTKFNTKKKDSKKKSSFSIFDFESILTKGYETLIKFSTKLQSNFAI